MTEEHIKKLLGINLFPGSLDEYVSLTGEPHQIMDTERPEKFVRIINPTYLCPEKGVIVSPKSTEDALIIKLLEEGCCALIRYQLTTDELRHGHYKIYWGIPVKKVK